MDNVDIRIKNNKFFVSQKTDVMLVPDYQLELLEFPS